MSLNDPQWGNRGGDDGGSGGNGGGGKRPNQGPPDLDELWRDLNRKLSGMFGGNRGRRGRGSNNDGGGQPPVEFNPRFLGGGIGLLIAVVVLVWLSSGFYIVDASQRGLVLQFGRYKESTEPGLRWRLPYPIQSHELVNVSEMRALEIGYRGSERNKMLKESLMLTDDLNIIDVQFAVQYILKDPVDYAFNNRNPDESVMQAAETAIREIVGKSRMDFVLNEGRGQIEARVHELMQEILDRYKTGIMISKVTQQQAQAPEQVKAAFDDAVKAGQDRDRQRNEGQAYANDVIPKARGTAARLLQEAEGYRQRMVATAEGDADRFRQIYTEYAKAPEVTRNRLYLETMQQIYANTTKVMIDAKGQGNLLYLPLDRLMQAAGAALPPTVTGMEPVSSGGRVNGVLPGEMAPQAVDRTDMRSRDALRSRDREVR
ncbi:MAG: FtsH protease activity modulator HflK [Candidatus Accumulibacter sp.]|jgi:membrane protease subunit HflK|nr:FtsH protease activity modulator HflK [Accumulibacter sp.]